MMHRAVKTRRCGEEEAHKLPPVESVALCCAEYDGSCVSHDAVSAQGLGLVRAVVDQTADFHVDTNGLRGSLKVQVDGTRLNSSTIGL